MHVRRTLLICSFPFTLLAPPVDAQDAAGPSRSGDPVALALSAAPAEVAASARVVDLEGNVLRTGSGPFTCLPVPGAPMCLDDVWMAWFEAYLAKTEPPNRALGLSYMLAGDAGASNTDPFAAGETPTNHWVVSGPHLMVLVPDPRALEGLPTDPRQGGPFVMWKGTPYAHVMVPVPGSAR